MTNDLLSIIKNASTWWDVYSELSKQNTGRNPSVGKLFEEFCKCYYLLDPIVKNEYRNVWLFSEIPQNIKTRLNLGKIDHGIDLVLEGVDGTLSVVQCKFRNNQSCNISWTKDNLANLFADGDKADYFIVFTNVSGLDKHSLTKKENQLKLVTLGDLLDIPSSTFEKIKNHLTGISSDVEGTKKEPRDDQLKAMQAVIDGFKQQDRGQLILPCGAGKTLVSLWIKEALNTRHTLVLVPSLALLRQIKNQWSIHGERFIPYICVCSEKDIDKGVDQQIVYTYEIRGKVSTNASEVREFLNSHSETIVYSTYQSLEVICDAINKSMFEFDLAICDEAHKTSGSKFNKFAVVHSNANIAIKKRLYMTATPRILSESVKSKLSDEVVKYIYDMSNPAIFGIEFYRMSFREAIKEEILVDYKIIAIGVSDQELCHAINQRKYISETETIDEVANNYALEKFMQLHGPTHAITFHSSVKKAKEFQARHIEIYPETTAFHVNGQLTTNERNVSMKEFEQSSKAVITNARCLTEGVDVPAIDVVYFCDPKNSVIDIVQASGRSLRRADYKQKKLGYIVVPIFHRNTAFLENAIEDSALKNLIQVIRAMCSNDEKLVEEITRIKMAQGQKIMNINQAALDLSCILILDNFEDKLKEYLFSQVIEKSTPAWYEKYGELIRFYEEHGHSNVPSYYEKNVSLSIWVGNQRMKKKNGKLSEEREEKLKRLDFIFDPTDSIWEGKFSLLCKYKEDNGHCNIPLSCPKHKEIISWTISQRSNYKKGKLSQEKIGKLDSIGFIFDPRNAAWEENFICLSKYREEHGNCNVPKNYQNNQNLSKWVDHQRTSYRNNNLGEIRLKKLRSLDFIFDPFDDVWEKSFNCLREYKENFGHCDVSRAEQPQLFLWIGKQRSKYQKEGLSDERIEKLKSIGFTFKPHDSIWEEMYTLLCKYNEETEYCNNSTTKVIKNQILTNWMRKQRTKYRNGTLSDERIKRLQNINFIFTVE
ncbi:MAG: Helicase associated domain protein [Legionellaceae bacterium]|nr:Helicase associated domain protein [Legionellaceae bacterium]